MHRPRADISDTTAAAAATPVLRTGFSRAGERRFFGFVFDPANLDQKFTVEIMVDGYPIRALRADSYVYELATEQVGDGCYGFSISLQDTVVAECAIVEARLANLGTPVGTPIAIDRAGDPARGPHGPGALRWLGGVRFSGWIGGHEETATVNVLVDGTLVMRARGTTWTHVGTAEDHGPVRGFDIHLPPRFADGGVHQLALVTEDGEHLGGSPLTFLAFADGFRKTLAGAGVEGREQVRAELLDQLMPMSVPFSHYHAWRENFPIQPDPSVALRAAVIMVGPGDMDDTLDSLHQQTFVDWVAASLPPTLNPAGFQTEALLAFLETDGAQCDFIVFGLAGTLLAPAAIERIAGAFSQFETAAAVYGDLDFQSSDGSIWPLCFPAFDYERMLEQGYCAHLFALPRATAIRALQAGGKESLYRVFNAVLDDGTVSFRDVVHLPSALGTLPAFDRDAASAALVDASRTHVRRRGIGAQLMPGSGSILPAARIVRTFERARTTIVIPTRHRRALLEQCIESIRPAVERQDAEIMVVDNDSADLNTLDYLSEIDGKVARVLRVCGDFNISRMNNRAAQAASGDFLCLLNDSITALDDAWLDELMGRIATEDVGAVGALLIWPSGVVQHGGVVLGPGFAAAHAFNDRLRSDVGYGDLLRVAHECSAVTAACLVTRRDSYLRVGGMDEVLFPVNFNDVDYCLKLRALGKRIVFTPHATLMHLGSTRHGPDRNTHDKARFERELENLRARWGKILASDPYYSPMLSLDSRPFSALAWPVRALNPRVNKAPGPVEIPPGF